MFKFHLKLKRMALLNLSEFIFCLLLIDYFPAKIEGKMIWAADKHIDDSKFDSSDNIDICVCFVSRNNVWFNILVYS